MSTCSYEGALEAGGATVHEFRAFGSYQGDWWAKVTYEGVTGWINGSYGSCSGCDALQAEFDYTEDKCDTHRYDWNSKIADCTECQEKSATRDQRFAEFGKSYLDGIMPQEEAEERAGRNSWDSDAPDMVKFIKENA